MSTISASTTTTTAYKVTADTTGTLVLQTGASPTTAVTIGSDQSFNFSGTGQRITGDFSNATVANRVMFQTSTANNVTSIGAIPNGTSKYSQFASWTGSTANESVAYMSVDGTNQAAAIGSDRIGTGTYLPMTFSVGGSERMRVTTGGQTIIGASSGDAYNPLQVQAMLGFSTTGSYYSEINNNLYYSGGWKNKNQGPASQIVLDGGASLASAIRFNVSTNATSTAANSALNMIEAMRIDSSGNLLVGVNSGPQTTFQRNTDSAAAAVAIVNAAATTANQYGVYNRLSADPNNTTNYFLSCVGNATTRMVVWSNGNVQNTNNSYGAISDVKLKENVIDATPKLNDLMQVRVVNYNLIGDEHKQLGVIAQEIEQIFPAMVEETVDRDEEGNDLGTTTKGVKYSVFVPMLIKSIQEQQAIIQQLTARIETLEAK